MQAEGQDQVLAVAPGHGDREVVVDAFLELVEHGEAQRRGELDFRALDFIDGGMVGSVRTNMAFLPACSLDNTRVLPLTRSRSTHERRFRGEQAPSFEFGPFRYDVEARALYRGDSFVALTPKAAEMLLVLLEEAGRVVTKENLLARVWPDVIVEEGGIANNISALRKILDQGGWSDEPIATVSRRGYRFTVPVDARSRGEDARRPQRPRARPRRSPRRTRCSSPTSTTRRAMHRSTDRSSRRWRFTSRNRPYVDVLPDRRVHATLRLMGRPTDLPVNGDTAFELCRRAGAKAMVTGSIFAVGDDYVIGLQAVDTEGDILASEQARAHGKGEVIKALDKAALVAAHDARRIDRLRAALLDPARGSRHAVLRSAEGLCPGTIALVGKRRSGRHSGDASRCRSRSRVLFGVQCARLHVRQHGTGHARRASS